MYHTTRRHTPQDRNLHQISLHPFSTISHSDSHNLYRWNTVGQLQYEAGINQPDSTAQFEGKGHAGRRWEGPVSLTHDTYWRRIVSFRTLAIHPPPPQGNSGANGRYGHFGEDKNILLSPGTEAQLLGRSANGPVTTPNTLAILQHFSTLQNIYR